MRAVHFVLILIPLAMFTIGNQVQHRGSVRIGPGVMLVQDATGSPANKAAQPRPSTKAGEKAGQTRNDDKQKAAQDPSADPNTPPNAVPWLGAPPQFQHTWPPSALPQSDGNDDLLLLEAPAKPPKVHKA